MLYERFGERLLDLVLTLPGLPVLTVLLLVLQIAVRFDVGRPAGSAGADLSGVAGAEFGGALI